MALSWVRNWRALPSPDGQVVRNKHTAVVHDGRIITFGGHDLKDNRYLQDLLVYHFAEQRWEVVFPSIKETSVMPCPRRAHSAGVIDGHMVVFGGFSGEECLNDLYALNLSTMQWRSISPAADSKKPSARGGQSSSVIDGRMYIFGGWDTTLVYHSDIWELACDFSAPAATYTWRALVPRAQRHVPSGRVGHQSVARGRDLIVFGGYGNGVYQNDVQMFNIDTCEWTRLALHRSSPQPSPRTYHSMLMSDTGRLLVIGGGDDELMLDDVWVLDLATRRWRQVPYNGERRFAHSSVVDNRKVYILGGAAVREANFIEFTTEDWDTDPSLVHFMHRHLAANLSDAAQAEMLKLLPRRIAEAHVAYASQLNRDVDRPCTALFSPCAGPTTPLPDRTPGCELSTPLKLHTPEIPLSAH